MKVRLPIFALMTLLAGCNRHGDAESRTNLSGTWTVTRDNPALGHVKSTTTVDPSGNYVCQVIIQSRWDGVTRTSNLAGRFEVRDGFLIDTTTKHSNTNARLPMISKARIVRSDSQELVVYEASNQEEFPTNEIVFRKVK